MIAIPAGTDRHPSPLSSMARRAAWRRSERRRRRRRRKRVRRRPSAGRRSNRSPLHSLRLRTTSLTASNGPAGVEVTSASLLHFDTPAPIDDRGRRRDKGSSLTQVRRRIGEAQRKGGWQVHTSPDRAIWLVLVSWHSPTPSVFQRCWRVAAPSAISHPSDSAILNKWHAKPRACGAWPKPASRP